MSSNREEALFALALEKPAAKRAAFLDVICEGDTALRQRLEALLAAHDQPDNFLPAPAEAVRPTIKLDLADAPDEAVGQTLGRYKLLERVGEGLDRECGDDKGPRARLEALALSQTHGRLPA